jgi:AcrR family transcriptional regulator
MSHALPAPRKTFLKKSADVRRDELISATVRCLLKFGVAETSVRTIAAEAGLSLGMVRHHFNSKDELLAATYRSLSEQLRAQTRQALERADPSPMGQLVAFIYAGLQPPLLDLRYVRVRFMFWELTHTNPVVRAAHEEIYTRFQKHLLDLVRGVAKANNAKTDCTLLTLTMTAFLKGVWAEWSLSNDRFDPRRLVDQMMPLWEAALNHRPESASAQALLPSPAAAPSRSAARAAARAR